MENQENMAEVFYEELRERFAALIEEKGFRAKDVTVAAKKLSPEEAIGKTKRKDYPILTGKDIMIEARVGNGIGQAFTDAPSLFSGTVEDILELDLKEDSHNRAVFIATLNAVLNDLGLCSDTVHCRNNGPELCSGHIREHLKKICAPETKIGMIGYQPSILAALSGEFPLRIMDLNPENIGNVRENVLVEDGGNIALRDEMLKESDLLLVTGSTICNGTIVDFLPYKEKILFYGTTLSGAAYLMHLKRLCYAAQLAE